MYIFPTRKLAPPQTTDKGFIDVIDAIAISPHVTHAPGVCEPVLSLTSCIGHQGTRPGWRTD